MRVRSRSRKMWVANAPKLFLRVVMRVVKAGIRREGSRIGERRVQGVRQEMRRRYVEDKAKMRSFFYVVSSEPQFTRQIFFACASVGSTRPMVLFRVDLPANDRALSLAHRWLCRQVNAKPAATLFFVSSKWLKFRCQLTNTSHAPYRPAQHAHPLIFLYGQGSTLKDVLSYARMVASQWLHSARLVNAFAGPDSVAVSL